MFNTSLNALSTRYTICAMRMPCTHTPAAHNTLNLNPCMSDTAAVASGARDGACCVCHGRERRTARMCSEVYAHIAAAHSGDKAQAACGVESAPRVHCAKYVLLTVRSRVEHGCFDSGELRGR